MRVLAILALFCGAAWADAVKEVEPNDDPRKASQVVAPGQTIEAEFQTAKDVDCFVLDLKEPRILSLWLFVQKGMVLSSIKIKPGFGDTLRVTRRTEQRFLRYRFPKGRHVIELASWFRGKPGPYRLEIRAEKADPNLETEPNHKKEDFTPLPLGKTLRCFHSNSTADWDHFAVQIPERGVYRLRFETHDPPEPVKGASRGEKGPIRFSLQVKRAGKTTYRYAVWEIDRIFEFYPILDPGKAEVLVKVRGGVPGAPYDVSIERFDIKVKPEHEAAAHKAIDRGVEWLIEATQKSDNVRKHRRAGMAMQLMALCEGRGAEARQKERAAKVKDLVAQLGKELEPVQEGTWNGKPISRFSSDMYEQSFITLAMAEAAAHGDADARRLCREGVRYLLATQITENRPEAWKVDVAAAERGGWRYSHKSKKGDLSVAGWCLIAFYAAAAAEIDVPGLVEAAEAAVAYVKGCGRPDKGFMYQATIGGRPTGINQAIGLLIAELFGERHKAVRWAKETVDDHLCAGTQAGPGHNSPFYYWYYATRANYLRSGYAWEAWRAVCIRQLVRRQQEDGGWAGINDEKAAGRRYSTAMAVMILRLCVGDPPFYMSQDVEGW